MKKLIFFSIILLSILQTFGQSVLITPGNQTTTNSAPDLILRATGVPEMRGIRSDGTIASPLPVSSGSSLIRLRGSGYNTNTNFSDQAAIDFLTGENFTSIARGTYIRFQTTALGTTSMTERMRIAENGNIGIGTILPLSKLDVSGDISLSSPNLGFGNRKLQFYSDQGTGNEWRPGYIASGDNSSFTGRLDFFTNGTSFANATGSVLGMSVANGRVGVGSATAIDPKFPLHVTSGAVSVSSTTGSFGIGPLTGLHLTFDTDEIQAWNNTAGSNFYFNQDSKGDVIIGGGGQGGLEVNGFVKLGSSSPKIKMLKFSGTTAVASTTSILHGLTVSKIISVNATINNGAFYYAPGSTYSASFQYDLVWNASNIQLDNVGTSLQGDPYIITVIYEE